MARTLAHIKAERDAQSARRHYEMYARLESLTIAERREKEQAYEEMIKADRRLSRFKN